MKIKYFAFLILSFIMATRVVHAQNRSFVQEDVVKVSGILTDVQVSGLGITQRNTTRIYYDGLGRPIQSVALSASPGQKDIVQPIVYDNLGRQATAYLPYASAIAGGGYRSNAINEQLSFYQTSGQKTAMDSNPYSQKVFENSPLQRVLQSGGIGNGFQPGQHFKILSTRSNLASETVWKRDPDGTYQGNYATGALMVTSGTDEEGAQTLIYTDQNGKTILKRQLLAQNGTTWADTYYVYNDLGGLVFVIPPKAVALMDGYGNYSLQQQDVQKLLFSYVYDDKARQVERTVPGGGITYLVYDAFDRLILAQDANLRSQQKWNYIKYDSRNTPVAQGIHYNGSYITRSAMQDYVNGLNFAANSSELRNGDAATGYYTNSCFPNVDIEPLGYAYYDDYDLDGNGAADYAYQNQGMAGEVPQADYSKGMPTIVRKRSVGNGLANIWLTSVMFYDANSNQIQEQTNNQLNAVVNSISTSVFDFAAKVIRRRAVQVTSATTVVHAEYIYDHWGRLKTVDEGYNWGAAVRIGAYEYNAIGQLIDRKLHSTNGGGSYLQSVDYRYNIQGGLTSINNSSLGVDDQNDENNDVFGMELFYNQGDAGIGSSGLFNGMISAVKWKVNAPGVAMGNERSYRFTYDKLSRLNAAVYAERNGGGWNNNGAFDEKNISYDLNGNILTLQRNAILNGNIAAVDDLNYSYDGNRLSNVSDGLGGAYGLFGVKNLTGSGEGYEYDASGNMTGDAKKGISLGYNVLNRTDRVTISSANGRYIDYTYEAGGGLIRKQAFDNYNLVKTTDYIGGFVYENNVLSYFGMAEGRVRNNGGTLKLEYMIKDQQGNVRVSFEEQNGVAVVRQENSYYPFGLTMPGSVIPTDANRKLYNDGSEWQDDFADLPDLQQTFYRMYDAALGRFVAVDPMPEAGESLGTYHYAMDNPVMFNDPMGDVSQRLWDKVLNFAQNGTGTMLVDGMHYYGDEESPLEKENGSYGYYSSGGIKFYNENHTGVSDVNGSYTGNAYTVWKFNAIDTKSLGKVDKGGQAGNQLAFVGGAVLSAGWAADGLDPEPVTKVIGAAVMIGVTAKVLYDNRTYLANSAVSLYNKMTGEIDRIAQKTKGPRGFTYALVAKSSGLYPNVRGGTTLLNAGEVWKYGQTTSSDRYSDNYLNTAGLEQINLFPGSQMEIKIQEKIMIYSYFIEHGALPPGNKIFR
ncbi:DUF6443 domain-containing protein [Pedobacter sp. 22163]|uniref:DUF6443 domain-containing protein n=1 Tax=Pedobacter sp. 22163 TaxID=3453883 RepID=UPI003F83C74A